MEGREPAALLVVAAREPGCCRYVRLLLPRCALGSTPVHSALARIQRVWGDIVGDIDEWRVGRCMRAAQELDDDLFYSDIKLQWPGDTVLFMLTRSARAKSISLRYPSLAIQFNPMRCQPNDTSCDTSSLGQLPTPASGAAARAPSMTLSNSTPLLGLGIGSLSNVAQRNTPSSSSSSSSVAAMMQPTPSNDLYPNLDNPQQYQQHQQQQHMSSMTMIPGGAPVDRRLSMLQTPMLGSPASAVSSSSSSSLSGFGHALADEATYSAMTGCSLRTPGASVMVRHVISRAKTA
mgnify:CR=1 FL=1